MVDLIENHVCVILGQFSSAAFCFLCMFFFGGPNSHLFTVIKKYNSSYYKVNHLVWIA